MAAQLCLYTLPPHHSILLVARFFIKKRCHISQVMFYCHDLQLFSQLCTKLQQFLSGICVYLSQECAQLLSIMHAGCQVHNASPIQVCRVMTSPFPLGNLTYSWCPVSYPIHSQLQWSAGSVQPQNMLMAVCSLLCASCDTGISLSLKILLSSLSWLYSHFPLRQLQ